MKIKYMLCIALGIMLMNEAYAQNPYPQTDGDVVIFSNIGELSTPYTVSVSCELSGIVFDHNAVWNDDINPNTNPQYPTYFNEGNHNYKLLGSTNEISNIKPVVSWESEYPSDSPASSTECSGQVGWGVYKYTLILDMNGTSSTPFEFYVNTVDGRWMTDNNFSSEEHRVIFRVSLDLNENMVVEVYKWTEQTPEYVEISNDQMIKIWDNNFTGSRSRAGIGSSAFTVSKAVEYPIGCNSAVIDVPLICVSSIQIHEGRSIHITDYFDGYTSSVGTTVLSFYSNRGIVVNLPDYPNARTYLNIHGNEIDQNTHTVQLLPYGNGPHSPGAWDGISVSGANNQYVDYNIHIDNCDIRYAWKALKCDNGDHNYSPELLEIIASNITSCQYGVHLINSIGRIDSCYIAYGSYGVYMEGYSYNNSHANTVTKSWIHKMEGIGLVVGFQGRGHDWWRGISNIVRITYNQIDSCVYHGVYLGNTLAVITDNYLWYNGYRNGTETSPSGFCGLLADGAQFPYHHNWAEGNTAYGLQADNGSHIQGNISTFNAGYDIQGFISTSNDLLHGLNCFDLNDFNVGASENYYYNSTHPEDRWDNTTIHFGQRLAQCDPYSTVLPYIADANGFLTPVQTDGGTHVPWQMTAEQRGQIWANHNLWDNFTWDIDTEGKIYTDRVSYSSGDVCHQSEPPQYYFNASTSAYTDEAEMILTRTLLGLTDDAVQLVYGAIGSSMDSTEINIRMLALRTAYIYSNNTVALDTLKKYAFSCQFPNNPLDYLTSTALVHLVAAQTLSSNWEGVIEAVDTIMLRNVEPEIKANYLSQVAYYYCSSGDSLYCAKLDSLVNSYPENHIISMNRFLLSPDESFILGKKKSAQEHERRSEIPRIVVYPNPGTIHQTFVMKDARQVKAVRIFDYSGNEVSKATYKYTVDEEQVSINYSMPSGLYFVQIQTGTQIVTQKILIERR